MVHDGDDPGEVDAGADISPIDPGDPPDEPTAAAADDGNDDLVSAVEDLVRELLPDQGRCAPG